MPETAARERSIIEHVRAYPGLTATQIARALRVNPSTTLKALRRMLDAGVVAAEEGRRTPEDWRPCTRWRTAAGLTARWLMTFTLSFEAAWGPFIGLGLPWLVARLLSRPMRPQYLVWLVVEAIQAVLDLLPPVLWPVLAVHMVSGAIAAYLWWRSRRGKRKRAARAYGGCAAAAAGVAAAARGGGMVTLADVDPLTVSCDHCGAVIGQRCMMISDWARKPHKVRVRLAQAVAAHTDPALDAWFPQLGPCGLCGGPFDQRHRVIDVIAGMLTAGEDPDEVAADYLVSVAAVVAVGAWAERWPGVWSLATAFAAWLPQGGVGLKRGRPFVRVGGFDHPPAGVFHGGQVATPDLAFDGVRGYALERGDLGGGHGRHAGHGSTRLPRRRASYGSVKLTR